MTLLTIGFTPDGGTRRACRVVVDRWGVLPSLSLGSHALDCLSQVNDPPDGVNCFTEGCLVGVADVNRYIPWARAYIRIHRI